MANVGGLIAGARGRDRSVRAPVLANIAYAGSATRYSQTYGLLVRHFATSCGWRFAAMVGAVLASGFLHPLPLFVAALVIRSAQAGEQTLQLGWGMAQAEIGLDAGITLVFVTGVAAFILHYTVGRLVNRETIAWQNQIYWELMAAMPRIARWDRLLDLAVPMQPFRVGVRIETAVRSAFLVGRLVDSGLRDLAIVFATLAVLLWLDARSVLVIAFVSLLFLPVYARCLYGMVRLQARANAGLPPIRQAFTALLRSSLVTRAGVTIDKARLSESTKATIGDSYGSGPRQMNELFAVNAVAGIHLFTVFYAVYVADGANLAKLPAEKLFFFLVLIVMLRSMQGLIGLMSRLTRSYEALSLMRSLLHPGMKRAVLGGPPERLFVLRPTGRATFDIDLAGGTVLHVLGPDLSFSYQLLPIANALVPAFVPRPGQVVHIPLLDRTGAILADDELASANLPSELAIGLGRHAITVPLRSDSLDLKQAPVLALPLEEWQAMEPAARSRIAAGRLILVLMQTGKLRPFPADEAPAAVSDGQKLIAAGPFAQMLERHRQEQAKLASQPQKAAQDIDDQAFAD